MNKLIYDASVQSYFLLLVLLSPPSWNLTTNGYLFLYFQVLKAFDYSSPWKGQEQMYKLDIGWPKIPEYFTGQTFCVAVDSLHGLVFVGQVSEHTVLLSLLT